MATESDAEVESVSSEMSLSSSSSSCRDEAAAALASGPGAAATNPLTLPFIRASDPQHFHDYIRLRQKMAMEAACSIPGVVQLQRIPHGFSESQLSRFFAKYGRIQRVRLLNSSGLHKKEKSRRHRDRSEGKSSAEHRRHKVAYIQFARAEDAQRAALDVAGLPVYNQLFKCSYLAAEQVPPGVFSKTPQDAEPLPRHKTSSHRSPLKKSSRSGGKRPSSTRSPSRSSTAKRSHKKRHRGLSFTPNRHRGRDHTHPEKDVDSP